MSRGFQQLESGLERGLRELGPRLDAPPPRTMWVEAVKDAVDFEARRWRRTRRLVRLVRPLVGMAAALLVLTVGFPAPDVPPNDMLAHVSADPDAAVAQWLGALEDSGERLTALVDQDTLLDYTGNGSDTGGTDADPLRLIEESLDHFESMVGA